MIHGGKGATPRERLSTSVYGGVTWHHSRGVDAIAYALLDAAEQHFFPEFCDFEFTYLGRRFALCCHPLRAGSRLTISPVTETGVMPPSRFMWCRATPSEAQLQAMLQRADAMQLRPLLVRREHGIHRLTDSQARSLLARMIHSGALELFEQWDAPPGARVATVGSSFVSAVAPASASIDESFRALAAPTMPQRQLISVPPEPMPARLAPDQHSMQAVDQDVQAGVLIIAARHGLPFCEECARHSALPEAAEA